MKILNWVAICLLLFLCIITFLSFDEYVGLITEKRDSYLLLLVWYFFTPLIGLICLIFRKKNKKLIYFLLSYILLIISTYFLYKNDLYKLMAYIGFIACVNILILDYLLIKITTANNGYK